MNVDFIESWGSDLSVVNVSAAFTQNRIIESVERGYFVTEDGQVFGPKGKLSIRQHGKQRYPTYTTNWGERVYGVPVHKLAAYCFYGEESFREGVVVRHLNSDVLDLSKSNIALGSYSDNERDKPSHIRKRSAIAARKAQGYAAKNRKLTEEQAHTVREFYRELGGKKAPQGAVRALSERLGVSRTVLCKIKNKEYYASPTY